MKLYEMTRAYEELLEKTFDEDTGEVNEKALEKLNELDATIKEKSIAVASYIKNLEAERKAIDEAKKEMALREKRLTTRVDYLTSYLKCHMEKAAISEISCPYFAIKVKNNPVSVNDYAPDQVPEEYKRIITEVKLDKRKIKDALLQGTQIPGVSLTQNTRLEIR